MVLFEYLSDVSAYGSKWTFQRKSGRGGQGSRLAFPDDKTLPIPLHETWPVVPGPSPPRPMDREPSTTALADHRARTVDLLSALVSFVRSAVRGPTAGGYGA